MKKINLKSYEADGINPTTGMTIKAPYNVKESIVNIMFNRNLHLNMVDTLKHDDLAKKILAAKDSILIENEEYAMIKKSFDSFDGYTRNEAELCRRITDAEEVKVEEKKESKTEAKSKK